MASDTVVTETNGGTALQVLVANDDHSFTLMQPALKIILHNPKVKDSKVIVLSIAGAFRKGKSFILNFILRYFHSQGSENWIGDPNAKLKGFHWQPGTERDTTGILMWSEPFEVALPSGEKACVLLMDTQGAFDSESTVKDCATVFALSAMLSSVQIYNIKDNIQDNELQQLQLHTEYGRLALKEYESKPFQDLCFLVRDWQCPYQYQYGWKGGQDYLKKWLEKKEETKTSEMKKLRDYIVDNFGTIRCFLMPHPGKTVATSENFDGRLSDIDEEFQPLVQEFVTSILSTQNLVVKEINGRQITGTELFDYFKECIEIFQGNDLPEPKTVLEATTEANHLAAVNEAKDLYRRKMEEVCEGGNKIVDPVTLEEQHNDCLKNAVEFFKLKPKMGYKESSCDSLEKIGIEAKQMFSKSNLINSANTFRRTAKICAGVAIGGGIIVVGAGIGAVIAGGVGLAGAATAAGSAATAGTGAAAVGTGTAAAAVGAGAGTAAAAVGAGAGTAAAAAVGAGAGTAAAAVGAGAGTAAAAVGAGAGTAAAAVGAGAGTAAAVGAGAGTAAAVGTGAVVAGAGAIVGGTAGIVAGSVVVAKSEKKKED